MGRKIKRVPSTTEKFANTKIAEWYSKLIGPHQYTEQQKLEILESTVNDSSLPEIEKLLLLLRFGADHCKSSEEFAIKTGKMYDEARQSFEAAEADLAFATNQHEQLVEELAFYQKELEEAKLRSTEIVSKAAKKRDAIIKQANNEFEATKAEAESTWRGALTTRVSAFRSKVDEAVDTIKIAKKNRTECAERNAYFDKVESNITMRKVIIIDSSVTWNTLIRYPGCKCIISEWDAKQTPILTEFADIVPNTDETVEMASVTKRQKRTIEMTNRVYNLYRVAYCMYCNGVHYEICIDDNDVNRHLSDFMRSHGLPMKF